MTMTFRTGKAKTQQSPRRANHESIFAMGAELFASTYIAIAVSAFLLLLAGWLLVTGFGLLRPIFLPSPAAVLVRLGRLAADGTLATDVGMSVYRIMVGFLIASVMALATAILIGAYRFW